MNIINKTNNSTSKAPLNPFSELHLAQAYYGMGQYQESLNALILAEEKQAITPYPDVDAITDDLMELLLKKLLNRKTL